MYSSLKRLFLFFIFLIFVCNAGAVEALKVDGRTGKTDLSASSELFLDGKNSFSYDDVSKNTFSDNFKPFNSEATVAGDAGGTKWIRFNIFNDSNSSFIGKIEMPTPWINKIDAYIKKGDVLSVINFDSNPSLEAKEADARPFFIPLAIEPLQSAIVYIKAGGMDSIIAAPQLYSQKKASERQAYIAMLNGVLIGVIFIVLLYSLNNYFALKDENYLNFALYLTGLFFLMGMHYGFNLKLFWNDSPSFNESIYYPIVAFTFLASLYFSRNFLKTAENFPKSDKYLLFLIGISAALCVLGFMVQSSFSVVYATMLFAIIDFGFLIYIAAYSLHKKISGSIYMVLAWLLLLAGHMASSLMTLGYIGYIYDFYAIAIILNVLMILFALADRIRDVEMKCEFEVQKEHEVSERLNLSKKELRELSEKLKRKVDAQERELLEKSKEYEKFSIKDQETGLYNKIKLEEILSNELHRSKRYNYEFSLIIINIDGMKAINDTHGFQVGNSVIKEMGDLFIRSIRYLDTVGRWSESEYLIICPETNAEHAVVAAEHLQKLVEKNKFFFVGTATACFGVTECHADDTLQEIMKRVYAALAKAKEGGRNRVEML